MTRVLLVACLGSTLLRAQPGALLARPELAGIEPKLRAAITAALEAKALPRAEQLLVDAAAKQPASPEMLTLAASIFLADHQPLNAAIALKKADKLRPLDDSNRFSLALAYIALKRGDWARGELLRLNRDRPENTLYLYWLARLDYDDQRFSEALEKLNRVVAAEPANVRARDNLGLNLEALGRLDDAMASYREAVRLNRAAREASVWPPLNLGTLALRLRKLPEAREALEEAVRLDPASPQAHYRMGILCEQEAKPDCAVEELRQAARLDEKYADPWWALARVLRRGGRAAEADRALAAFKKLKAFDSSKR